MAARAQDISKGAILWNVFVCVVFSALWVTVWEAKEAIEHSCVQYIVKFMCESPRWSRSKEWHMLILIIVFCYFCVICNSYMFFSLLLSFLGLYLYSCILKIFLIFNVLSILTKGCQSLHLVTMDFHFTWRMVQCKTSRRHFWCLMLLGFGQNMLTILTAWGCIGSLIHSQKCHCMLWHTFSSYMPRKPSWQLHPVH